MTLTSDTDYERMCTDVYLNHERGGMCGQEINLYAKGSDRQINHAVVNCTVDGVKVPEVYAVMALCSSPCMDDPSSICCFVPSEVAMLFPCSAGAVMPRIEHPGGLSSGRRAEFVVISPSPQPLIEWADACLSLVV